MLITSPKEWFYVDDPGTRHPVTVKPRLDEMLRDARRIGVTMGPNGDAFILTELGNILTATCEGAALPGPELPAAIVSPDPPLAYRTGDLSPCQVPESVLWIDRDPSSKAQPPQVRVEHARFTSRSKPLNMGLHIEITAHPLSKSATWTLRLSSTDKKHRVYPGKFRVTEEDVAAQRKGDPRSRPEFVLNGERGCYAGAAAEFEVHNLRWTGDQLAEVLVSFSQDCRDPRPMRGCLHYVMEGGR
jgi:hypothetical protein